MEVTSCILTRNLVVPKRYEFEIDICLFIEILISTREKRKRSNDIKALAGKDYILNFLSERMIGLTVPKISVWHGHSLKTRDDLLSFILSPVDYDKAPVPIMETVPTSYEFREMTARHVFVNFAARNLGGGYLTHGYVQEEKLVLISSLLNLLVQHHSNPLLKTRLDVIPMLIKSHILFHEDVNMNIYGREGLHKIADKPALLRDLYKLHRKMPSVYFLCRAIYKLKRIKGETYTNNSTGTSLMLPTFLLALDSYILAIECLEHDDSVRKIHIHDGNWGCGAFGHNYNTIYVILHFAIRLAVHMVNPKKVVMFHYHTYTDTIMKNLKPAIDYCRKFGSRQVSEMLNDLLLFQEMYPQEWEAKLE